MFALNKTEINALSSISQGSTSIKEIAKGLDRSQTRSSVIVRALEEKGFLARSRVGLEYKVILTSNAFMNTIRPLLRTDDPRLSVITDNGLFLLGLFSGEKKDLSRNDLVRFSDLSPSTVRDFLNVGVKTTALKRRGRLYHISHSSEDMLSFIREYSSYSTGRELVGKADDIKIHWRLGFETIYSTGSLTDDQLSGPTRFKEHGMELIMNRIYHHFTPFPRRISVEEAINDNILLDRKDPRNVVNSALFIKKNGHFIDRERLLFIARVYNIEDICLDILSFIDGRTDHIKNVIDRYDFDEKLKMY